MGDQSPKTGGNGGVEREFDLARTDRSAGVRESRENVEDVIERNMRWEDERWSENGVNVNKENKVIVQGP